MNEFAKRIDERIDAKLSVKTIFSSIEKFFKYQLEEVHITLGKE